MVRNLDQKISSIYEKKNKENYGNLDIVSPD